MGERRTRKRQLRAAFPALRGVGRAAAVALLGSCCYSSCRGETVTTARNLARNVRREAAATLDAGSAVATVAPETPGEGDLTPSRPAPWVPLLNLEDVAANLFGDFDTLKVYHLLGSERLVEVGALRRPLGVYLSALGFHDETSGEKVALSYLPKDLTFSLTPSGSRRSSNGQVRLVWETGATVVSALDIAEEHWDIATFLGTCSSQTYRHMVDVSIEYGRANPDFQPFSVYNKYPGSELLRASSPDDFVWHLISEFGRLGVTLHPVLAPKRVRMVLFSNRVPDTLQVSNGTDRQSIRTRASVSEFYDNFSTCLKQRRFQTVDSFESFATSCDCLQGHAILMQVHNSTHDTYRSVSLSSNQVLHVVAAETIDEPTIAVEELSSADFLAVSLIVAILFFGINGILIQTKVYECLLRRNRDWKPLERTQSGRSHMDIEMVDEPAVLRDHPRHEDLYTFTISSLNSFGSDIDASTFGYDKTRDSMDAEDEDDL